MITKIDIDKFGLFEEYKWDTFIGRDQTLRRLNIIYGRNYSGKTTLSRILNSVFEKKLPQNYENGKFRLTFSDNSTTNLIPCCSIVGLNRSLTARIKLFTLHKEYFNFNPPCSAFLKSSS